MTFDIEKAEALVKSKVKNKNLIKHMYAVQHSMRNLAKTLNEDENLWELVGLVHDIDYEETSKNPAEHGIVGANILKEAGYSDDVTSAVLAHVGNVERDTRIKKEIFAVDGLTGLIVACALIHPSKSLEPIDVNFVLKRFKEKRFAAGANRDSIKSCEELGLSLEKFTEITLCAIKNISDKLGL